MSEILVSQVMPVVQFGTYKLKGEDCYRSVRGALEAGYRGLDTASVYDNEKEVGRAVLDSGVPRDQVGNHSNQDLSAMFDEASI